MRQNKIWFSSRYSFAVKTFFKDGPSGARRAVSAASAARRVAGGESALRLVRLLRLIRVLRAFAAVF